MIPVAGTPDRIEWIGPCRPTGAVATAVAAFTLTAVLVPKASRDMTTIGGKWRVVAALALVVAPGARFESVARGQIAFQPNVSALLNGAALTAAPVVSPDRRYVRMTLSPYFNTVNGFTTYTAQLGAVGGAGFGGVGGGAGGGGLAGMGGVIGGPGMGGPMVPMTGYGDPGTYLAGDFPPQAARLGAGPGGAFDAFQQPGIIPMGAAGANPWPAGPALAGNAEMPDPFAFADVPEGRSVRAAGRTAARRQAARRSARRPTPAARRGR